MVLSDKGAYRQVIGSLMLQPLLFLEYPDLTPFDFDSNLMRICFSAINNLYSQGATKLSVIEVDQEIERWQSNSTQIYKRENGVDFLNNAIEIAEPSNFEVYYNRVKKYALLRRLHKEKYDISDYFIDDKDIDDPKKAIEIQQRFEDATIEEILNNVEGKYNIIRNDFLNGGKKKGDAADEITELIDKLKNNPSVGPSLEGKIFSTVFRGARSGCFYLKAASTSAGKTRTSVFDACHLAYPIRWSYTENTFMEDTIKGGEVCPSRKVLFIVTEMDKEELQTIMLAYLSGVNEDHIIRGKYEPGEESRVRFAAHIMEENKGNFIIEEISEPNLTNVEATIKRYATVENVKYIFFDYIHTTASLVGQFTRNNLREDTVLMMLANQLKQLAKDYNVFIFSATQVNANAMTDDESFKNETCIRGAKAIADKADGAYVMTRVSEKMWNSVVPTLRIGAAAGKIDYSLLENPPTHVLDVYKMRRGRFKNVRIWIRLDLGNGEREDLFMTTADNKPIGIDIDILFSYYQIKAKDWKE